MSFIDRIKIIIIVIVIIIIIIIIIIIEVLPRAWRLVSFEGVAFCGFRLTAVSSQKTKWQPTKFYRGLMHKYFKRY